MYSFFGTFLKLCVCLANRTFEPTGVISADKILILILIFKIYKIYKNLLQKIFQNGAVRGASLTEVRTNISGTRSGWHTPGLGSYVFAESEALRGILV